MISCPHMDQLEVKGKRVLVRADLNVPMQRGKISDDTRISRLLPTLRDLLEKKARVILMSHFDRPEGKYVPSMSLAPIADALAGLLGRNVQFAVDCVGPEAAGAVAKLKDGEILLLENLRFHAEEEKGEAGFIKALASLGDLYVNDAFSCSHRAHASIVGLAEVLPHAAGKLMQAELEALENILGKPAHPFMAVVGGSKISTKITLLGNLLEKVDVLMIGGAMANTFLAAQGLKIGASRFEPEMVKTAKDILAQASAKKTEILLPVDAVTAKALVPGSRCKVVPVSHIPQDEMVLDLGPQTIGLAAAALNNAKTLVWNGPVGAFETAPFDCASVTLSRIAARLTFEGKLQSIAGGGDTVSALTHAGVGESFTYLSTAGGAFLEWLEGKTLPGIAALCGKGSTQAA